MFHDDRDAVRFRIDESMKVFVGHLGERTIAKGLVGLKRACYVAQVGSPESVDCHCTMLRESCADEPLRVAQPFRTGPHAGLINACSMTLPTRL